MNAFKGWECVTNLSQIDIGKDVGEALEIFSKTLRIGFASDLSRFCIPGTTKYKKDKDVHGVYIVSDMEWCEEFSSSISLDRLMNAAILESIEDEEFENKDEAVKFFVSLLEKTIEKLKNRRTK